MTEPQPRSAGEAQAWSVVGTLVAGPSVYGLLGFGVDALVGTSGAFVALGIVLGAVTSFYIVFMRHFRG